MMNRKIIINVSILILWGGGLCSAASAEETVSPATSANTVVKGAPEPAYTKKGADTCAKCHDEDNEFPVYSIYKTKHAQIADERSPFAGLQCEACHGPGAAHAKSKPKGEAQAPIETFGNKSKRTAIQQNKICLDCHQGQDRVAWHSSVHETNEVTCTSCHKVHVSHDPVLSKQNQPEACYRCHKKARSEFLKPSAHPVRFGKMTCSDCHQSHGAGTKAILKQPTINETCYSCHAEKRGPLLWEHAPVTEDCTICHNVHGSVQPSLLKKRAPVLCQQCHSQFGHPSVPRSEGGLPGNNPSAFLLSGSCTNCHSQVHGSNHPSGIKLMR